MASDRNNYALHRITRLEEAVAVLKQTLERRYPPNEAVDNAVENVETELSLLRHSLNQ